MLRALILAGGMGTRLKPALQELPKPLAPIAGRPFISYPLSWLRRQGVEEITLCLGYKAELFIQELGNGEQLGIRLSYSIEEASLGTGGALKFALMGYTDPIIVLNGDTYLKFNLASLLTAHKALGGSTTLALKKTRLGTSRGCVELNNDGRIEAFIEKPLKVYGECFINAGVYIFAQPELLEAYPAVKFFIGKRFFSYACKSWVS